MQWMSKKLLTWLLGHYVSTCGLVQSLDIINTMIQCAPILRWNTKLKGYTSHTPSNWLFLLLHSLSHRSCTECARNCLHSSMATSLALVVRYKVWTLLTLWASVLPFWDETLSLRSTDRSHPQTESSSFSIGSLIGRALNVQEIVDLAPRPLVPPNGEFSPWAHDLPVSAMKTILLQLSERGKACPKTLLFDLKCLVAEILTI